jgi:hypothetical protein
LRRIPAMIIAAMPYSRATPEQAPNLGQAYNLFMARLLPEDWAVLIDHDAMFTTTKWHTTMEEVIDRELGDKRYPESGDTGLFVTRTNRVGCGWMKLSGVKQFEELKCGCGKKIKVSVEHDIRNHRQIGRTVAARRGTDTTDVTEWEKLPSRKPLSGVCMVLNVHVWREVGRFKDGFLTVDNDMHRKVREAGYRVRILEGVYVYHWYRAEGRGS